MSIDAKSAAADLAALPFEFFDELRDMAVRQQMILGLAGPRILAERAEWAAKVKAVEALRMPIFSQQSTESRMKQEAYNLAIDSVLAILNPADPDALPDAPAPTADVLKFSKEER